ncbi:MAG: putative alpha/beta hydrolase superfamily protein [Herbaspirillum sp.]|nr:putative alpha/beta hydrolase superfamily protein [Herbaspirillum sp.]
MKYLTLCIEKLFFVCSIFLISNAAIAARVLEESSISINGEERPYFHLHDSESTNDGPIILLVSGSGCDDFGARFRVFFEQYRAPLNVYLLEKPGIKKGSIGLYQKSDLIQCSEKFNEADQLDRRVSDNLVFLEKQEILKARAKRSIAVLGFSEGSPVALLIASKSEKIGWLATGGSGGLKQSEEFLIFADRGIPPYATLYSRAYFLKMYDAVKRDRNNLKKEFLGHSYKYWASHLFFDPLPIYAKLDIPIVVAMGEKDESVPIESGRVLQNYFRSHPEKNFQFIEFKNANHSLQTPGKNGAQIFVADLRSWFKGDPQAFSPN